MNMIDIKAGKSTPRILLDSVKKQYIIEGQSYPENSSTFYEPVISWIKEHISQEKDKFILQLKLLYINTSSTKAMFYLFDILEDAFISGIDIHINWMYDQENEMAKETGEELLEDLKVPYSIIEV
jgi:hypothetical protein